MKIEAKGFLLVAVCALAGACTGSRAVAKPTGPEGYQKLQLRELGGTELNKVNIEFDATVGLAAQEEICDGQIWYSIMNPVNLNTLKLPQGGTQAERSAFVQAAFTTGADAVTLTIPASRGSEVKDLKSLDRIRVRGYLSNYVSEGCAYYAHDNHRYLWVDSIEKLP